MSKVVSLSIVLSMLVLACTEVETNTFETGLSVTGVGRVEARPDTALINLGVEAQGSQLPAVRTQAAEAMSSLLQSLRTNGISGDDAQTDNFVVRTGTGTACATPFTSGGPPFVPPGGIAPPVAAASNFCVLNRIQVRVRNLEILSKVLDDAVAAGGSVIRVDGVRFTLKDLDIKAEEARQLALKNAREQASRLADGMDITVGDLVHVATSTQLPQFAYDFSPIRAPATGGGIAADTPIQTGIFDIVVVARARFEID